MSFSPFDSGLYRDLLGDAEMAQLFSDSAEVRAMMLVLGALAKVQGQAGVIPEVSGQFLHRATMEIQIDPGGLTEATGRNGVSVPGLVAAMRKALDAPEHAQYLHWGATSQDIQDTAMMLRMRRALTLIRARQAGLLTKLADLAEAHAATPQAARTYGQVAVPSSFGALVATWGAPLLRSHQRLAALEADVLSVSLSGAAGTGRMLGPDPAAIRAGLAEALGLSDPLASWHAERGRIADLAAWLADVTRACGKIGEDMLRLTRSELGELGLSATGASSTMPQKQNPVGPSVLVALARLSAAQASVLTGALHGEARDGAAWFAEWLTLPQLVVACAKSLATSAVCMDSLVVQTDVMAARLDDPLDLVHAETLSFALARAMPRDAAQSLVKQLAGQAKSERRSLVALVRDRHPDLALPDLSPPASLGQAPAEARQFAALVRAEVSR
jgi:3-carboxy-cis,cis-muconate cycloisomerase